MRKSYPTTLLFRESVSLLAPDDSETDLAPRLRVNHPVSAAAPARRLAGHREARAHQWVEEASHICREKVLYACISASRAVGAYRYWPEGPEASWSFSDRPVPPVWILASAGGPSATWRYFHRPTKLQTYRVCT
jgi:hypothetical protein